MESQIHSKVQKYYGGIAKSITQRQHQSCCGCGSNGNQTCCDGISSSAIIYNGENLDDLPKEALDASLGCANPVVFAQLKKGETVDLVYYFSLNGFILLNSCIMKLFEIAITCF